MPKFDTRFLHCMWDESLKGKRCLEYQYEQDNLPVSNVMVRKWEDEQWVIPTREYMGLE